MSMIQGAATDDRQGAALHLEQFVRHYHGPMHAYLCRSCQLEPEEADDVLQQFLLDKLLCQDLQRNIAHSFLQKRAAGYQLKFRGYLLRSLRNFVADRRRSRRADQVSLDAAPFLMEEQMTRQEEDEFSVEWATHLLRQAMDAVRADLLARPGQEATWEVFEARVVQPAATGRPPEPYESLAPRLRISSPKQASNRLQTALRRLRVELRRLVANYLPVDEQHATAQIEEEIGELIRVAAHCRGQAASAAAEPPTDSSASLYSPSPHADDLWGEGEYGGIWEHLRRIPLDRLLAEFDATLARQYADVGVWRGFPLATLADLWRHPEPPLDILQSVKSFAKRGRPRPDAADDSGNGLPTAVNAALYTTALAAAWLRHQTRLSRDSDERFVKRLRLVLRLPWLEEPERGLLAAWLSAIT